MELAEEPIYEHMFYSTDGESGAEIPSWVNEVKAVWLSFTGYNLQLELIRKECLQHPAWMDGSNTTGVTHAVAVTQRGDSFAQQSWAYGATKDEAFLQWAAVKE